MIRKLLFAAAAAFVGKKLMDRNRDKSMNGPGSQRATNRGNRSTSFAGSAAGTAGGHAPTDLMTDRHPGPNERADEAFRPDPHSTVAPGDRDAMRPATKPIAIT